MICKKCKKEKPKHHFSYRKDQGKLRAICRSCSKGYKTNRKDWIEEIERLFSNGLKKCGSCNEIKPLHHFNVDKNTKTGRTSYCKPCVSSVNKKLKKERSLRAAATRYGIEKKLAEELYKTTHCQICKKEISGTDKHIDHCHDTGKVRGVLCRKCNLGLGYFDDNFIFLEYAITYLRKSKYGTEA